MRIDVARAMCSGGEWEECKNLTARKKKREKKKKKKKIKNKK